MIHTNRMYIRRRETQRGGRLGFVQRRAGAVLPVLAALLAMFLFDAVGVAHAAAPTARSNGWLNVDEDRTQSFGFNIFAFSYTYYDSDGDPLAAVKIVTLPAKGTLWRNDGVDVTANHTISLNRVHRLKYTPPANEHGRNYTSFTFKVIDSTSAESLTAATFAIHVIPRNDPATGRVTINGTARVGETLTIGDGVNEPDGRRSSTYRWYRVDEDGNSTLALESASKTYTLRDTDVGYQFFVTLTIVDNDGTREGPFSSHHYFPRGGPIASIAACSEPDFTGKDPTPLWTNTINLADQSSPPSRGYDARETPRVGSLTDPTNTGFLLNSRSYTVQSVLLYDDEPLILYLSALPPASGLLFLHVCDHTFRFKDAFFTQGGSYQWSRAGLDWDPETTRTLYISRDGTAPTVSSATVNGTSLVITFNEDLGRATLVHSAFVVKKKRDILEAQPVMLDGRISISGKTVTLTLETAVTSADTVTVSYIRPNSGNRNKIIDSFGNEAASFTDQAVTNNTPAPSNPDSGNTPAANNQSKPGRPTSLTATAIPPRINLSWTAPADNGSGITGYKIEWSATGSDPWTVLVATTGDTATTYSDTSASAGDTRHYRVSAINDIGTSEPSSTDSASLPPSANTGTGDDTGTGTGTGTRTGGGGGGGDGGGHDDHANTPAQATLLPLTPARTAQTSGRIDPAPDVDYFTLLVPHAGTLVVTTTGSTDTVGRVWQGGEELTVADGGGERQNFRLSVPVVAGRVVIAVAGNGRQTGAYTLQTTLIVGYLENPGPDSFQSGLGVLSGWVCEAEEVEIELNGARQFAAYGTARLDTEAVCGDSDNGFGLLFNWNLLGDGEHEVVARVDGVELGRAMVTVTTLGKEFLRDVTGTCEVEDFPTLGEPVTLAWQQTQQNFVIVDGEGSSGANRAGRIGVGYLENPGPYSFQSGIGVISGWVCEAEAVEITLGDLPPQRAAYGTERRDTEETCGDTDNGFGLLFNWNLLDDGEHVVVAYVDDTELGRATVRVTTLGEEFLRGVEGECVVDDFPMLGETVTLEWQQTSQNFVITQRQ